MKMRKLAPALMLAALGAVPAASGPVLDGGHIVNSGSTNTAGWEIALRSDGNGTVTVRGRVPYAAGTTPKNFTAARDTTARFFTDVRAARAASAAGGPVRTCMKSASFGTTTVVQWHDWRSPDLECPQASPQLSALAADVNAIRQAARIPLLTRRFYRIPYGPRRTEPTPTPRQHP